MSIVPCQTGYNLQPSTPAPLLHHHAVLKVSLTSLLYPFHAPSHSLSPSGSEQSYLRPVRQCHLRGQPDLPPLQTQAGALRGKWVGVAGALQSLRSG